MSNADRIDRLLALARDELGPSENDQARSRLALGLRPKAPAIAYIERATGNVRSWSALRASGKAGLMAGALLLGAGFGAGDWMAQRAAPAPLEAKADAQRHMPAQRPVPTQLARDAPHAPIEPAPMPAPALAAPEIAGGTSARSSEPATPAAVQSSARRSRHRRTEAPAQALDRPPATAGDELALLRRVERALRAEDPALALALLTELDQRFPRTDLVEERAAANVLARCAAAEPGAHALAERFLRERPTSVYAGRIRASCGLDGSRDRAGEGSNGIGHE